MPSDENRLNFDSSLKSTFARFDHVHFRCYLENFNLALLFILEISGFFAGGRANNPARLRIRLAVHSLVFIPKCVFACYITSTAIFSGSAFGNQTYAQSCRLFNFLGWPLPGSRATLCVSLKRSKFEQRWIFQLETGKQDHKR